jgi:hypothetical protein
MFVALAVVIGSLFLWELLSGGALLGWAVVELVRQLLLGDR